MTGRRFGFTGGRSAKASVGACCYALRRPVASRSIHAPMIVETATWTLYERLTRSQRGRNSRARGDATSHRSVRTSGTLLQMDASSGTVMVVKDGPSCPSVVVPRPPKILQRRMVHVSPVRSSAIKFADQPQDFQPLRLRQMGPCIDEQTQTRVAHRPGFRPAVVGKPAISQGIRTPFVSCRGRVQAIVQGKRRLLLTMATGTGKTTTAFQICWKLWNSRWNLTRDHRRPKILYLADRNILVDDPMMKDFAPFGDSHAPTRRNQGHVSLLRKPHLHLLSSPRHR